MAAHQVVAALMATVQVEEVSVLETEPTAHVGRLGLLHAAGLFEKPAGDIETDNDMPRPGEADGLGSLPAADVEHPKRPRTPAEMNSQLALHQVLTHCVSRLAQPGDPCFDARLKAARVPCLVDHRSPTVAVTTGAGAAREGRLDGGAESGLFANRTAAELRHDIEVPEMAGVLLEQVEENPFERRRVGAVPAGTWLADGVQVVGLDDRPSALALGSQRERSWSAVSSGETYHRPSRWSPHGSSTLRPAKPHSSHRSSTKLRCLTSSRGVQPDCRRLLRWS